MTLLTYFGIACAAFTFGLFCGFAVNTAGAVDRGYQLGMKHERERARFQSKGGGR